MPSVSTMVYPSPAYVRVEVNWADVGSAISAAVYRVDCLTGARVPLRPYVCFDGDFLDLSCGYGVFWDTESQLDRCVYYCTQAINAAGEVVTTIPDPLMLYTFSTVIVNGWGPVDTGQTVTLAGGTVPGDYDVTAGRGTMTLTSTGVARTAAVNVGIGDMVASVTAIPTVLAATQPIEMSLWVRSDGTNQNGYRADLVLNTSGQLDLLFQQVVAGVASTISTVSNVLTYNAATLIDMELEAHGGVLIARVWDTTTPKPTTPTGQVTTATLFMTNTWTLLQAIRQAGNTNANVPVAWDNWRVGGVCDEPFPIESCSDDLVVPSSGDFRLGDPVRPCNDVVLQFDPQADPDCVPTQGIFFGNMSDEDYPASSGTFLPTNSPRPIVANRARRGPDATLTVATRTFADRDALRTLNAPGSPLLARGPAQYGIDDRYMSIGDVNEHRPVSDHKVQPRAVAMPHLSVDRPSGPSQGVCGTRVQDLCDIYPTWNALIAAGLTYADLLRGKASNDTPIPDTVERTWAGVNALYASWTAANAANADWDTLREGT